MTLSNNYNGKVELTETVDFIFSSFEKVKMFVDTNNVTDLGIDKANTNSFYFSFDMNEKSFEIRISNHTKRMQAFEEMVIVSVTKIGMIETLNLNVFNAESLSIVLATLEEMKATNAN